MMVRWMGAPRWLYKILFLRSMGRGEERGIVMPAFPARWMVEDVMEGSWRVGRLSLR